MNSRAAVKAVSPLEEAAPSSGVHNIQTYKGPSATSHARLGQIATLKVHIAVETERLLEHRYFQLCRTGSLGRAQMIGVLKELYCFSTFFERILTLRIARHSTNTDSRTLDVAREHLAEEMGHVTMFRDCLLASGVCPDELKGLAPKTLTKALYGYLLATVLHENDYVINVAVTQVMETIGEHFFRATSAAMKVHRLATRAVDEHAEEDGGHASLGMELAALFDDQTMQDSRRVIADLYRLMPIVFDEWLGAANLVINSATA